MPPRLDRIEVVPPVDPEGDQTPGHHADESPITVDDPDVHLVASDVLIIGPTRQRGLGLTQAGVTPRQPRRGEILVVTDEATRMTQAVRYVPPKHGDRPPASVGYNEGITAIPREDERRGWRSTAMHEAHTNLHNPTPPPQTPEQRRSTLALGGFFTKLSGQYAQPEEPAEESPPTDDASDIPWV